MRYIKRIANILCWPVYICIIIFLLIAAPILAGYRPVVVLSGSMEPTYRVGSIVYYKQASFEEIQVGDPVTFRAGENSLVTHRVVQKLEVSREFVTQGDANNAEDPAPVAYSQVVGRTGRISLPYMGFFVGFCRQPLIIGIMVGILALGFLADRIPDGRQQETGKGSAEKDGGGKPA